MNLASFIRDIPDFPKPGIVFKDITPLLLDAGALDFAVEGLAAWARPLRVDFVVAAEARGFILGAALARELGVGFVPARKPGKLPGETVSAEYILEYGVDALEMHADALAHGARVLLHDDLLATGGTAARARRPGPRARRGGRGLRVPGRAVVPGRAREARRDRRRDTDRLQRRVRREQVFWGWGEPGAGPSLPEHARELLQGELGVSGDVVSLPVALEDVSLPAAGAAGRAAGAARGGRGGARRRGGAGAAGAGEVVPGPAGFAGGRVRFRAGRGGRAGVGGAGGRGAAAVRRVRRRRGAVRGRDERRRRARGGARAVLVAWCPWTWGGWIAWSRSIRGRWWRCSSRGSGCPRPMRRCARRGWRWGTCRSPTSGRRSAGARRRGRPGRPRPGTGGSTSRSWRCRA